MPTIPSWSKKLGIDEISKHKGQGHYVLVLTDLERRLVVDILPNRLKDTLKNWLQQPPAGIDLSALDTAAIDLWSHYRDAVSEVFGEQVSVVADRFHVVQNLNEAIHGARREAQSQAQTEAEKKQLKGLRYLLIKKDAMLTAKDKERLQALKNTHPDLYQITRLRQRLYDWYDTDTSPEVATKILEKWLEDAAQLEIKTLDGFGNTLQNWKPEILSFFSQRVTSGFVQGINCKIRLIKRIAFGLPNFDHFRLRILWTCG